MGAGRRAVDAHVDEVKKLAEETGDVERMFQWGWLQKTLTLTPGKYMAYCAPHESTMFQHFTVVR